MNNKDNNFENQLYAIFESHKLPDENNFYKNLYKMIKEKGLNGFKDFEEEIVPKKFKAILAAINDLLKRNSENFSQHNHGFINFIEFYLSRFNIKNNGEEVLQSKIVQSFVDRLSESLEKYKNEIDLENLKLSFVKTDESAQMIENSSLEKAFAFFYKSICNNEKLISIIVSNSLNFLIEALYQYKEEILPKTMKEIITSIRPEFHTNQINSTFSKDYLLELKNKINQMPKCLEKCIEILIFNVILKIKENKSLADDFIENLDSQDRIIENELNAIEKFLKNEQDSSQDLITLYNQVMNKMKSKEWNSALTILKQILKKVRPLDIHELSFLLKEAKKAAKKIINQDVILLMGKTGSGKSTTIHFLAGSKMIKKSIEIEPGKCIEHISPEEPFPNEDLCSVITSSKAESETRYINPISVNLKDIGGNDDKTLIICDSPGFGDTAGHEVDIANGIGIIEAIKETKSIIPVFVMSYKRIGDNGEGIRELAHFLVNMVSNIKDYSTSFCFLFTKFPPQVNINAELLNIKKAIKTNPEDSKDESFNLIIDEMIDKTENEKPFDPLNEKPIKLMNKLIRSERIQNPKLAFRYVITEESKAAKNEQLRLLQLSIMSATKRQDFELIKYKLDDLIFLNENLKEDHVSNILNHCINYILNHVKESYINTKEHFNSYLERHNKLELKEVEFYREKIEKYKALECFKGIESLAEITGISESLFQNLKTNVDNTLRKLEEAEILDGDNFNTLENLKLIISCFKELDSISETIKDVFFKKAEKLSEDVKEYLGLNQFHESAHEMNKIIKATKLYIQHFDLHEIKDQALNEIINYFKKIPKDAEEILNMNQINENNFLRIKNGFEVLEKAKETIGFRESLGKESIIEDYESLIHKTLSYFERLKQKVLDNQEAKSFKQNESLIKETKKLRSISIIESRTSETYHSTMQHIIGELHRIENETMAYLDESNQIQNKNYSKIYSNLKCLKEAGWLIEDKRYEYQYDEMINNIKEKIIKDTVKLRSNVIELNLDLSNYKNLESANKILQDFEYTVHFETDIPELEKFKEDSIKKVNNSVDLVIQYINSLFNLQNQSILQLDKKLDELKKLQSEYNMLNPSSLFLKKNGFQNIEELNESTGKCEQDIKKKEEMLDKSNEQYAKLTNISESSVKCKPNKKNSFLNQHGFADSNKLDEGLAKLQEKIENSKDSINQKIKIKECLLSLKKEYDGLSLLKAEISDEAKDFISKTKYKNIENLENEIRNITNEANNISLQGHEYIFNRIDLATAENSLNYLYTCCSIRAIREKYVNNKNDLENYIRHYKKYIETESSYLLNQIEILRPDKTSEAFGYAQKLKNILVELTDIKNYESLNKLVNSTKIINELVSNLENIRFALNDKLTIDASEKKDLRSKLETVKALSQLDTFVDGKFYSLYREYQAAVTQEFKDFYKKIVEYIDKFDYMSVSAELLSLDESPINQNTLNQIKRLLSSSITELIEKTKGMATIIPNTLETKAIQEIIENLKKLESANKYIASNFENADLEEKFHSSSYIDKDCQEKLQNGIKEIKTKISDKVKKYLESIQALIRINNFFEAEENREHINNIHFLLGNHCMNEEIKQNIEAIHSDLDNIVNKLSTTYDEKKIEDYALDPPKEVLDKLQKVANRSLKYNEILNKIKATILSKLRTILNEAKNSHPDKRNELMQLIESALESLPVELKDVIKVEIENIKKLIEKKKKDYETDFKRIAENLEINAVKNFMEKCKTDGMNSMLIAMQQDIIKKSCDCKDIILKEDDDIKNALKNFQKLLEYKASFGETIGEIERYCADAENHLIYKYEGITSSLIAITTIENEELAMKLFLKFKAFTEFQPLVNYNVKNEWGFFPKIQSKINHVYLKISDIFYGFYDKYNSAKAEFDFESLNSSMNDWKKWQNLLKIVKTSFNIFEKKTFEKLNQIKNYNETVDELVYFLNRIRKEVLDFDFKTGYDKERENFYKDLAKKLDFLKKSKELKDHIHKSVLYDLDSFEKDVVPALKKKFQTVTDFGNILEKNIPTKSEFDKFRISYENLVCFENNVKINDLDFKSFIDTISTSINKKLELLNESALKVDCSIENLARNLENLKKIADNLPHLNEMINEKIDEILLNFSNLSKSERGLALAKLGTELEKSVDGVGLTIISEHRIFKGQTISLFNQDTQRHDIDYVLEKLDGTDVDKETIKDCYKKFNNTYESLVKEYINLVDKKNDKIKLLDGLIRKTKLILDKVKINKTKEKSYEWGENSRHKITELMSHIFALWTLMNNEYFEQMKDVEGINRESYLLTPHPGQIVSILRLLGIGYCQYKEVTHMFRKNENIRDYKNRLKNNLIQVGTGEGKSLILAVASCILVLLGAEVNCVCYSEYLSSRDYESFRPLFEALDITKNIHYGTFNKICENFLNDCGDIRSRVLNLIHDNKNDSILF